MKSIALNELNDQTPPKSSDTINGGGSVGFAYDILPYIEQGNLYSDAMYTRFAR